jgi:hypothetical protein
MRPQQIYGSINDCLTTCGHQSLQPTETFNAMVGVHYQLAQCGMWDAFEIAQLVAEMRLDCACLADAHNRYARQREMWAGVLQPAAKDLWRWCYAQARISALRY